MRYIRKTGLLFSVLLLLLTLSIAAFPSKSFAYDGSGPLYVGKTDELNNLGKGTIARTKVSDALSAKFLDIGHINVTLNVPDLLFDFEKSPTLDINKTSFKTAYSGTYTMAADHSEWHSEPHIIREESGSGGSYIYVTGIVKSWNNSVPDFTKASKKDIDDWLAKGLTFYAMAYAYNSGSLCISSTSLIGCDSHLYALVGEGSDTKIEWHQRCENSNSSITTSCARPDATDTKDITGLFSSGCAAIYTCGDPFNNQRTWSAIKFNLATVDTTYASYRYTYSSATIYTNYPVLKGGKNIPDIGIQTSGSLYFQKFLYCNTAGFFQSDKCAGNGDIITSDDKTTIGGSWKGKADANILSIFENNPEITVSLQTWNGKKAHDVVVLGGQSPSAKLYDSMSSGASSISINCDTSVFNPLTWLLCPMVKAGEEIINKLDVVINNQLTIGVGKDSNFDENTNGIGIYQAWSAIRTIALSLLVLIALIMVISQAISVGPFDAYTVKKVLPRIAIAVIAVTLSWQFSKLFIAISNDIGQGIGTILLKAAGQGSANVDITKGATNNFIGVAGFAAVLFSGLNLFAVVSFVFVGALGIITALLTIVFRRVLITFLVILAPIAIILWILPNTRKAWSLWQKQFMSALVAFPIIVAFITMGRVFSSIASRGGSDLFTNFIVFISYFLPYFMLPVAFRLAGGAIAQVGGLADNFSKAVNRSQRKRRAESMAHTRSNTMAGRRYKPNSLAGRLLNRTLQTGALTGTGQAGINPFLMRSRINASRGVLAGTEVGELLEKNAAIAAVSKDDHLAEAVQTATNRAEIEQILTRGNANGRFGLQGSAQLAQAVSLVERAQKAGSQTAVRGAMAVARANSGTGYATSSDMYESILQAAGGDTALEGQLLAAARSGSERARRPDLASVGHVEQALAMNRLRATMGNPGGAAHQSARQDVNATMRRRSFETAGVHAALAGRTESVTNMVDGLGTEFNAALASGNVGDATELASQISSVRGAMGSATPEVRKKIMGMLNTVGIKPNLVNPETGQVYSSSEQLGSRISGELGARGIATESAQGLTQEILTRAGAYDVGGGTLTREQMEERRRAQPPNET